MSETLHPLLRSRYPWVLPGVQMAFCPKRKIAPHYLAMGDFNFPPSAASDSRHNLGPGTTVSRGAAGRVCLRAQARRYAWITPSFISLYSMESRRACQLASIISAEHPTVVQVETPSVDSMSTRTMAAVARWLSITRTL